MDIIIGNQIQASGLPGIDPPLPPVTTVTTMDYSGTAIYENNVLTTLLVEGGYVSFTKTGTGASAVYTPTYHFYMRDHLGSIRVVASTAGTAEQVSHYYPYGSTFYGELVSDHRFKYCGKELDKMHGLDWYDSSARYYDHVLGRFHQMDPMAEKYYSWSPYAYCENNPISFIDPKGKLIKFAENTSIYFKINFILATTYLKVNNCGDLFNFLDVSPETYTIKESDINQHNNYEHSKRTISWLPYYGLHTLEEKNLSPATLLNHEFAHAVDHELDPVGYCERIIPYTTGNEDNLYYSPEEKYVISEIEQRTALALGEIKPGEITRFDHFGTFFKVDSPISNYPLTPLDQGVIIYGKKRNHADK